MPSVSYKRGRVRDHEREVAVGLYEGDDVFETSKESDIVAILPGNPGLARFYFKFARHLMRHVGEGKRCVVLSYAGHGARERPSKAGPYSVYDQVSFVSSLVQKMLDRNPDARLHLIGHSVGAFVAVCVASGLPEHRVASVLALFPTVEHIAKGSNARVWPLLLPGVRQGVCGMLSLMSWLPLSVRRAAVPAFATTNCDDCRETVAHMADYHLLDNVTYMARTEFEAIRDLDPVVFSRICRRSTFYYGQVDGWVAPHLVEKMRDNYATHGIKDTSGHVVSDKTGAPHGFVLTHSEEVAAAVAPILRSFA